MQVLTDKQVLANIAANVERLRGDRSKSWLAREVGVHTIQITRIEAAENMPGSGLLVRLSEALGVKTDDLTEQEPLPEKKSSRQAEKSA